MTISLHNVNKSFGEKRVLQDLSCTLKDKTWTLITGPSGCGKTTLFRILLGLEKADSGEIQGLTGRNSAVFQENRLCEELTTADNIRLAMSIHRNDKSGKEVAEKQIDAALKELGLLENENQPVSELSGGMKRRCAIARAVLADADLYLLDEPFYGLDKKIKEDTMDFLIRHLNGKTVVLITHDKEAIEYLKSRRCVEREIILAPI